MDSISANKPAAEQCRPVSLDAAAEILRRFAVRLAGSRTLPAAAVCGLAFVFVFRPHRRGAFHDLDKFSRRFHCPPASLQQQITELRTSFRRAI